VKRTIFLLTLIVAVCGAAYPQEGGRWHPLSAQAVPSESFTWQAEPIANGVRVHCTLDGLMTRDIKEEGRGFTRLSIHGLGTSGEIGTPEMPAWRRFIEVPLNAADVRLTIVDKDARTLDAPSVGVAHSVYPVQPPRVKLPPHGAEEPFAWNKASYARKTGVRPAEVELAPVGVLRGRRLYMVTLYPFDYSPAKHRLTVRESVVFDVRWTSGNAEGTERGQRYRSPLFDSVVNEFVLNAEPDRSKTLPAPPIGYLIITDPAYAANADLADFVDWKTERGFHTTLVTTGDTGTTTTSIKAYIQDAYDTWIVPPTFVLLIGDTGAIPHWVGTQTDNPDTDLYYTTVDGAEWNTPDIAIGRFAVSSAAELGNVIKKTLDYEQGLWPGGYEGWEQHATFMAGNDNFSITEGTHNTVISNHLDPGGYTSDKLYMVTYGATRSDVSTAVNAGRSLAVYSGHGAETSWVDGPPFSQANVGALTNEVYPFVMSFACLTGQYSLSECFGETWLRDESGSLAFYGSSVTSYWDQDDILERGIFEGAFDNDMTLLPQMCAYGMQSLYTEYGGEPPSPVHRYFEMYNLLGDPTVDLYMGAAGTLTVSHPTVIPAGAPTFTVDVAQDGALVALSQDGTLLGAAVSSGGSAVVTISPPVLTGEVLVTVTRHNYTPYQDTVLVFSGPDGIVDLDKETYTYPDTVSILVADSDLEPNGTQAVTITTSIGGDSETVTLPVTATAGVFLGTIETTGSSVSEDDGSLQVLHGDVITVTYEDLDNGTGNPETKTDTAAVDAQGPTISNVQATVTGTTSATVTFDTDEPASAAVSCCEVSGGPYDTVVESAGLATSHSLNITGLSSGTLYYYEVDASDSVGNQDAETTVRSFTTLDQVDYFTEIFTSSDNDLDNLTITFTPNGSADFYGATVEAATAFPTNPSGGSVLSLADDGYAAITLSGEQVSLYGTAYSGFYVGSNGYITFTQGDTEYMESLANHFAVPRISGLFVDLAPPNGGTVSWQQLGDRAVVTYDNVPEYPWVFPPPVDSFQVEMFFNGTIRITWLNVGTAYGLAGLSEGEGTPGDFAESDLSAYPAPGADTDDDGLSDEEEVNTYHTDPNDPDTDDDGLSDGDEVNIYGTEPNDADSDDDGLPDGWEIDNGLDPNNGAGGNGADGDPDGDGLNNAGEHVNGTDANDADSDDDTLPDGWEVDNGLNPNDDTGDNGADGDPDGDGYPNEDEYYAGSDPQDETSVPAAPAPVAAFSASVTSGIRPLEVAFTYEATGQVTGWEWDFDDGYTSTEQDLSHTYYFTGDYTVTLTVTGPGGIDSATDVIHVDQALPAQGAAYKAVINGVKVTYSRPTCFACYNDLQDSLLIAVWGDEPGALTVASKEDAPLYWTERCDVVIDAPDTYIKKVLAKGIQDLLDLYVCGQAGYVKNFILKDGYVGNTLHYGEALGLGSTTQDPAKKVLIKRGATTAALFGLEYPVLRLIPASVEEALANLELEIKLKSKPFVGSEIADYEYDYEYDEDDEDIKLAEFAFDEVEASVETKAAYVTEVNGVKVRYSKPGCTAYYNADDDTLRVNITESGGNLLVKCGDEAYVGWGDVCDLVILGADTSVNTMVLKGNLDTQLYIGGNVAYVKNFKLKYGAVGGTDFYGPDTGLGCTSLIPPNKILIKWGWTTAPLLGVSY